MSGKGRASSAGVPGFTLLEVVLVMAIMAILAGVAVPRVNRSIARHRVSAAAYRVATDLAIGRRHALTTGSSQTVTFDVSKDEYVLNGMPPPHGPGAEYVVKLSQEPYFSTLLSASFNGSNVVTFDGYGVADSDGSIVVEISSLQKSVDLDSQTGIAAIAGDPVN